MQWQTQTHVGQHQGRELMLAAPLGAALGSRCGFDTHQQVKERKRHILVDTLGLILAVVVAAASVQDRNGTKLLLVIRHHQFSRLWLIWADQAYVGEVVTRVWALRPWRKVRPEIVKRPAEAPRFELLPEWWIVERTLVWLGR
jgi:putative transposase